MPVERVVLVDAGGRSIGTAEKLKAHRCGLRHRAVSVFLLDGTGAMLIQRRAPGKYHSPGLWANACCSHPHPGERIGAAARRRLQEELNVRCALRPLLTTSYHAPVPPDLIENEHVHFFLGHYTGPLRPDPAEVTETRWITREHLLEETAAAPGCFAVWFRIYLTRFDRILFGAPA